MKNEYLMTCWSNKQTKSLNQLTLFFVLSGIDDYLIAL